MRLLARLCTSVVTLMSIIIYTFAVPAAGQAVTEDFLTAEYRDTLTTAWWDTIAGELKLYPFEASIAGSYGTSDIASGVAVEGFNLFVADGSAGLVILDIRDRSAPSLLGSAATPSQAMAVSVSGDHAYVATKTGLSVFDVSDTASPSSVGSYTTAGTVSDVAVDGRHAFIVGSIDSLIILDVSDPSLPSVAGSIYISGNCYGVAVDGDRAFVAAGSSGLIVFDVSDPSAPSQVGVQPTSSSAEAVSIDGDYAIVADGFSGISVIDISDPPSSLSVIGTYGTSGYAFDAAVDGDFVLAAIDDGGIEIIDISTPSFPALVENVDTPGNAYAVCVAGEYAFVADAASGVHAVKTRSSAPPLLIGSDPSLPTAGRMKAAGDYLFIASGPPGLQVVDISDPSNPSYAGAYDSDGQAWDVDIAGNHAYMADGDSGLVVIDITDPTSPAFTAQNDTFPEAYGVVVRGDYAYLAAMSFGLVIFDITDPADPAFSGNYPLSPYVAYDIAVEGDYAYLAAGNAGIVVCDISDPTNPVLAGSELGGTFTLTQIAIQGDHGVVSGFFGSAMFGVYVIDISYPASPTLSGEAFGLNGVPQDLTLSGDLAYITYNYEDNAQHGIEILRVTGGSSIGSSLDRYIAGPVEHRGVAQYGDYLYLTGDFGLQALQVFNRDYLTRQNMAQSINYGTGLAAVKVTAAQTDSIMWAANDGFGNWFELPRGDWTPLSSYNNAGFEWRSYLYAVPGGGNPTCSQLDLEFLYQSARIDSVVDIPGDQGGWARVCFTRSGMDFAEAGDRTEDYCVWRRIDGWPSSAEPAGIDYERIGEDRKDYAKAYPDLPLKESMGRFYIDAGAPGAPEGFPPGTWEILGSFPAFGQHEYIYPTSTLADSSAAGPAYSVFLVTAHYRDDYWVSEPDSGYSVDNIAPGVPLGLAVAYNTGSGNELSWDPAPEPDFQYYRVYRGDSESFVPGPGNLAHETAAPAWTDPEHGGSDVHYKVTALDHAGNESEAASAGTTTGDDIPAVPNAFALYQNAPNPFNPSTTIRFDLPHAAHVRLSIYNVKGELVSTLVDRRMTGGRKEVTWTAAADSGRPVSSGVYFYRINAGEFEETRKMILLR